MGSLGVFPRPGWRGGAPPARGGPLRVRTQCSLGIVPVSRVSEVAMEEKCIQYSNGR